MKPREDALSEDLARGWVGGEHHLAGPGGGFFQVLFLPWGEITEPPLNVLARPTGDGVPPVFAWERAGAGGDILFSLVSRGLLSSHFSPLWAGGPVGLSRVAAALHIFAFPPGTTAISGAATQGLGVIGSSSDIRTQGGDTTLAGLDAFTDVLVASTGAINIPGPVEAGRNVTMTALAADLQALATPGGTFIDTVRAGNNLTITTSGDITGGRVSAGGDLLLTGDSIAIVRAQTTGTGQLTLTGPNGVNADSIQAGGTFAPGARSSETRIGSCEIERSSCLLYTSDAADERSSVDLGGRRIIKKKK